MIFEIRKAEESHRIDLLLLSTTLFCLFHIVIIAKYLKY